MITGLSAFPLTPLSDDALDEQSFIRLVERLEAARVDSITVLGSTGSYAYLSPRERRRVLRLALATAGTTPVYAGVGALRTSHVVENIAMAESEGAAGVLLAPMTYQKLNDDEVFELYRRASDSTDLPLIVYDNPSTTGFTFGLDLYARIAQLPAIASIKIPPVPLHEQSAQSHVRGIRQRIPPEVSVGVSGDPSAAAGLAAGCDVWYSVVAGTLPEVALPIVRAVQTGENSAALEASERLAPLWKLFEDFGGSLRVVAAIAEHLELVSTDCLPLPVRGLDGHQRERVAAVVEQLELS